MHPQYQYVDPSEQLLLLLQKGANKPERHMTQHTSEQAAQNDAQTGMPVF